MKNNNIKFWLPIVCVILGCVECLMLELGLDAFTNIIVELTATALSLLICLGVLKSDKNITTEEIKDEITKSLKKGDTKKQDDKKEAE